MKRRQFLGSLGASAAALALAQTRRANVNAPGGEAEPVEPDPLLLWYLKPAKEWIEALPLGNGRLGAMVFGNTENERIQLNEDTVWSGGPYDPSSRDGRDALPEIRRQVFAGKYLEAHRAFGRTMFGLAIPQMQYQPLADLHLTFPGHARVDHYRRQLDLDQAIVTVTYRVNDATFRREIFSSPADQVIAIRLTADRVNRISFEVTLVAGNAEQRCGDARWEAIAPQDLVARGRAMSDEGIEGQVRYQARLRTIIDEGTVQVREDSLKIAGANAATILISAATSFRNYRDAGGDPDAKSTQELENASSKPYDELRRRHVEEHRRLFRRVQLILGSRPAVERPTDERLKDFAKTNDPSLVALYFQFGRYLLISSSRPGCRPANLQGIWNDKSLPPWGSKYTTNINLQMSYWPAEVTNLSECAEPLFQMVADLVQPGSDVASKNYGAEGWVLHQNTDQWLATAPMDGPTWGTFATGGAWLCTHLWDHYLFSGNQQELERFYPLIRGASEFFLSTLVKHPQLDWIVTCPSMSPEHIPKRPQNTAFWDEVTNLQLEGTTICAGPTMDMQILRYLFEACIEASKILNVDADFRQRIEETRRRLAPLQIGRYDQLQEWLEDWDDPNDHHRHVSHLWGVYPGHEITPRQTPPLSAAAAKSLLFRGDGGTGWSMAWKLCVWARLLDGERAYRQLRKLLVMVDKDEISYKDGGTYLNLLNALPFQIDGNMGSAAGIAEMVLQSHAGEIHLLPALPTIWERGSATGLKARGGFVVNIEWTEGRLIGSSIGSTLAKPCKVRTSTRVTGITCDGRQIEFARPETGAIEFQTEAGKTYLLGTRPR